LIAFGQKLFAARWTSQDGAGRPLAKGTPNGPALSQPSKPLGFPFNFNRLSGPDANSCAGCHNLPQIGGGGDIVANVFVLGQRFDFLTFDANDALPGQGTLDERGRPLTLRTFANERKTIGMNGSGFVEMLARQMTAELQAIRNALVPGTSRNLFAKDIFFGTLTRRPDGTWDASKVQGLPPPSLVSDDPAHPPSLVVMPFHQSGAVVSLRQFTINAFHQHHGIQAEERFGVGVDQDGDGLANELTRADVTAAALFQATLPVPGQVIPSDPEIAEAIHTGEKLFEKVGCSDCHVPKLPLIQRGWIYSEPSPYNAPGTLRAADVSPVMVDLTSDTLPGPRLKPDGRGIVWVPAYTDLKLHDITSGPNDPNAEPLDQNQPAGSEGFFAGNRKFVTRKLWGLANSGPFMHHGKFTTIREAVLAHSGEALQSQQWFESLAPRERDSIIEFLKSLQVLPAGAKNLIIDER
jgi:hypothetical protein